MWMWHVVLVEPSRGLSGCGFSPVPPQDNNKPAGIGSSCPGLWFCGGPEQTFALQFILLMKKLWRGGGLATYASGRSEAALSSADSRVLGRLAQL
uniref:Uncharacterized protein n=1 Tax=Knipowitschia caucasica TaxID=637954 RepID=A0AAV2MTB4_KNICA